MSLIKKPSEIQMKHTVAAMIYGQPGTGKTTLACSAPHPVLFDFDNGVSRVNGAHRVDTVPISKWEEALEALEEVKSLDYETIVIDTAGKMLAFMEEYIKRVDPKKKNADGSLSLKGFGVRKQMFINFLKEVLISGKNIIFVAHEMEQKRGEETVIRPEVGGSSANDLIKELDLVGYVEMYGKRRTISFFPCEKYYAKNSCNLPGLINIPVLINEEGKTAGINDFMTKIIGLHVSNLEASAEETRRFENLKNDILGTVAQITNADEANSFVESMKTIDHIYNSRAVAVDALSKKVKELGLSYDKATKTYCDAEPSQV
ncbi:MAG: ATP-binding protein [Muribaculaceae bacterium]|nr:ATP-binding protein [Muribaculaceae bacterium]